MKIIIIEVEQDVHQSVYTITLRDRSHLFLEDCVKYGVTNFVMDTLKAQGVHGWISGTGSMGTEVKRTYMLVEDMEKAE